MTETSPDALPLIDLELLDLDAQTLIDQALTDAVSKVPEWTPREGHTEVVLLESQALIAAELVYAVNRLPDAILEALLVLYGLERDPGAPPVASFTFTTSSAADLLIPAGTRVRIVYDEGNQALDFTTDADLLIAAATGTGTTAATADDNTAALNGLTGLDVELVDAISAVDTVTQATQVTAGVDPEDSATYQARGANLFRRLVSTLVLPEHFTAAALEDPAVERATTLDLYNPDAVPAGNPGAHPGHVTVAAAGAGGTALAPAVATALVTTLEEKAHAALEVHVIAPTVTPVTVTVTIRPVAGSVAADVEAAVEAALTAYLDPDTWAWGGTVYRNELIALVDRVAGVDRVVDLTAPAADVVLAGVAPLASAGTITATAV